MAEINPWVEVWNGTSFGGTNRVSYDWQSGKEYILWMSDNKGDREAGVALMRIPFDIPPPTFGISGMRCNAGPDSHVAARVFPNGSKEFRTIFNEDNRIYKVLERDLNPDPAEWSLAPTDDTYEFELWNTSQGRTIQLTGFEREYEYLFILYAPESSTETYFACGTFYNFNEAYNFPGEFDKRHVVYWWDDNRIHITGLGTSPQVRCETSPSAHRCHRIYRRKLTTNASLGHYNSFPILINHGRRNDIARRLEYGEDYLFAMSDQPREMMYAFMRKDEEVARLINHSRYGFANKCGTHAWLRATTSRLHYERGGDKGYVIYQRARQEEYVEPPPPDPDPPPPPPDPDPVNCEDICLLAGETYVAEASVEVEFINPPDWTRRSYGYTWSTPDSELSVIDQQEDGRIAIIQVERVLEETDDRALIDYDVSVVVEDLDYQIAGVSDTDDAVVTFEMPCVIVANETTFSINDISVDECGPGDVDRIASFTVTSDEAIIGDTVTIDYEVVGITASSDLTITVLASDSNDLPFLMVRETPTTKLYLDGSFTRFWNQNAGNNGTGDIMVNLLANIPEWASDGRNTEILIIEDIAPNAYLASATGTGGFATTLDVAFNQVLGAPWNYTVMTTAEVESEDQAFYEGYALVIYFSTSNSEGNASELGDNHSMITDLPAAARAGVGVAILADHDIFYHNANKILREIDSTLQFTGGPGINRTGEVITVAGSITKHGDHPLFDGLSGQFPVATSEAYIPAVTANPDFRSGSGTVSFPPGSTQQTISVDVFCDDLPEQDETFKVILSNVSRGFLGKSEGIGTIVDAEPNETTVRLAQEGESFEVYIYRDISGSMGGTGLRNNSNNDARRDDIAVQILNDFEIPSANVVGAAGASVTFFTSYVRWVLDRVPANQEKVSILFITDAEDGYGAGAPSLVTYTSPANNHPQMESHGQVFGAQGAPSTQPTAVVASDGSTWASTIGTIPATINEVRITVVRLLPQDRIDAANQSRIDGTPNNTAIAEDGFNGILTTAPAVVTQASFETFSSYTTGDDSVLNDRIAAAVLATWDAFCSKDQGNVIQVQAADEQSAIQEARPILNCPDDP
jgi:hypothetical protein